MFYEKRHARFAARLTKLRKEKGFSKTGLANKLGVTTTCVWNWEEANTMPGANNFKALAEALEISVHDLRNSSSDSEEVSNDNFKTDSPSLAEIVNKSRFTIAAAAAVDIENVTVTIKY